MNQSGIHPKGDAILILLEQAATEKNGIALPDMVIHADQMSTKKAMVIEIGPLAWIEDTVGEKCFARCQVGENILFGAYKGEVVIGKDKKTYRVIRSRDIYATYEE